MNQPNCYVQYTLNAAAVLLLALCLGGCTDFFSSLAGGSCDPKKADACGDARVCAASGYQQGRTSCSGPTGCAQGETCSVDHVCIRPIYACVDAVPAGAGLPQPEPKIKVTGGETSTSGETTVRWEVE